MARATRRPLFVHLGNVGSAWFGPLAEKTAAYSARFPNTRFVGIDKKALPKSRKLPENWTQIKAGFAEGLGRLDDNSVHVISSDMAVGHYIEKRAGRTDQEMLEELLNLCHDKLKPDGKILLSVGNDAKKLLENAFGQTRFTGLKVRKLVRGELLRTPWTENYASTGMNVYQFTASKPGKSSR